MTQVYCQKLQKEAPGLERAPYPGALGLRILENVSKEAWQLWMGHQTILINENHLMLHEPKTRTFLETEMEKFFFGGTLLSAPPADLGNEPK